MVRVRELLHSFSLSVSTGSTPCSSARDDNSGGAGFLSALVAGAAGLASALESSNTQQSQQQALRWPTFGDSDDSSDGVDAAAEFLKRMLNPGNK